jgi:uncharacterized protein YndB with AHSA1/START domain
LRRPEEACLGTLPTTAREVIEVERWIGARPETVFSYFTDPERFLRWQGEDASIDPHPGGAFRMSLGGPPGAVVRGEFLEVVAPRKLVFTWGWEGVTFMDEGMAALMSKPSTVEISLESKGEGTLLRLRQTGPAGSARHTRRRLKSG